MTIGPNRLTEFDPQLSELCVERLKEHLAEVRTMPEVFSWMFMTAIARDLKQQSEVAIRKTLPDEFFEFALSTACTKISPVLEECNGNDLWWLEKLLAEPWDGRLTHRLALQRAAVKVAQWSDFLLFEGKTYSKEAQHDNFIPTPDHVRVLEEGIDVVERLVMILLRTYSDFEAAISYKQMEAMKPLAQEGERLREARRRGGKKRAQQRKSHPDQARAERNRGIVRRAERLLSDYSPREIPGMIAQALPGTLSSKTIKMILADAGLQPWRHLAKKSGRSQPSE